MTARFGRPTLRRCEPARPDIQPSCSTVETERIAQARNLLLNPHYSLSEIAEHLGFPSVTRFHRSFKQHTGLSPEACRLALHELCIHTRKNGPLLMKETRSPDKLHILILYSDRISGHEAMRACDHVLQRLDKEHWFEFRLWRLDLLDQQDIRAQASRDVAAADIIVVSVDDEHACSESFQRWAKNWPPPRRRTRRVLVAFQPAAAAPSSRSVDLLRELAVEKGMDLISPHPRGASTARALPVQWKESPPERQGPLPAPTRRAEFARDPLEETTPAFRRWGINE